MYWPSFLTNCKSKSRFSESARYSDSPAVLLPAVCQVTVPAKLLETVVVTLAVAGEINGPGHNLDVHQIVDYPANDN